MRSPVALFDEIVEQGRRIADLGRRGVRVWRDVTSLHAEGVAARARDHARAAARRQPDPSPTTKPTKPETIDVPRSATDPTSRADGR